MNGYGGERRRPETSGDGHPCGLSRREDLIDFVDGTLAGKKVREIEQHLRACEPCRTYVNSVRRTLAAAGHDRIAEPPEAYWACFGEVVRRRSADKMVRSRRRRLVWRLVPGLAVLAVAVGAALHYFSPAEGDRHSGTTLPPWAAIEAGGPAGVDSLVVALLARVPDEAMVSLEDYLAGDDDTDVDVADLACDLPRSAKQNLIYRLTELMKLKG